MPTSPMPYRGSIAAALVLATLGSAVARPVPDQEALRARYSELLATQQRLERERQVKARIEELVAKDDPWLVLDLGTSELHILVRVTVVHTVPLRAVRVEGEKSLFGSEPPPAGWSDGIFDLLGKSGPQREPEKIKPKDPEAPEEDPATMTPEKLGLVEDPDYPSRYTLVFRQGIAVTLGGGDPLSEEQRGWIRRAWDRVRSAVSGPELPEGAATADVKVWVNAEMDGDTAKLLYPSLFTGMRAILRLPGDPPLF